jgi:hypothetical protein
LAKQYSLKAESSRVASQQAKLLPILNITTKLNVANHSIGFLDFGRLPSSLNGNNLKVSKLQGWIIILLIHLYKIGPMRAEPSSIRNSFFKDIIIKKTCKITPLVLVSKPEIAAVEKIFKVTNAKDFLQNKLHSKSKYKPIFETSIKSANKNPFIHAQTRRNSLPYAPHRIAKV